MHYAGIACDMDTVLQVARYHNLAVVEDAAHAIDSYHCGRPLGSLGQLATFSFHETKNIISGEGGLLAVNDSRLGPRAEIIREKGTSRTAFFRGEIDKYGWVDVGSSFLPSDIIAAYLWAQLENLADIQRQRRAIWERYRLALAPLAAQGIGLPVLPDYATNNAHLFYLVCRSLAERTALIAELRRRSILAVFHYVPLHASAFYRGRYGAGPVLPWADHYGECLVRLPLFYELSLANQNLVIEVVLQFYQNNSLR